MFKSGHSSVLALILAGGKGERLYPLTAERTKPSVPFGGKYRIIDFALSNMVNSGIYSMYVLVQYKSQSLIEHIRSTWSRTGVVPRHFITVVPPQMRREEIKEWYRGTADSVYQNINLIYDFKPAVVAIFGGDHIYRMDINKMVEYHLREKAHLTISVVPIKSREAVKFGIVEFGDDFKIKNFKEKPQMTGEDEVYASMGNYIFDAEVLVDSLEEVSQKSTTHDFGHDIIPHLVNKGAKVMAYDFSKNKVPSIKQYEDSAYWRDVGNIESFWQANMDLLGGNPRLDLDNEAWPIYSSQVQAPSAYIADSEIHNVRLSEGSRVHGSRIRNSLIGRSVKIDEGCEIEDSIIMDFTQIGKNVKIKKTIIDRYNIIKPGMLIDCDRELDPKIYYKDPSGITVLRRGSRRSPY